jgi:hypothetical protein
LKVRGFSAEEVRKPEADNPSLKLTTKNPTPDQPSTAGKAITPAT